MIIGIAGAGGIGSNVARHLAQARISHLRVVDFDSVEISNLNRQFYSSDQTGRSKVVCLKENLLGIYPAMAVEAIERRMEQGDGVKLFSDCGLVVEGFDDKSAKKNLIEDLAGSKIPIISASGIAGRDMSGIRVRKIGDCSIVGDFSTDVNQAALFPPKIAMIAAMMAGIVLELIGSALNEERFK